MATKKQSIISSALVALSFALSSFTALRVPGLPFGASELLLMVCMVLHFPLGQKVNLQNTPHFFPMLTFFLVALMIPGYFATLAREGVIETTQYNLIASVYIVVLVAYLHFGFDRKKSTLIDLAKMFVMFSTLVFVIILALVYIEPSMVYPETVGDQELNVDLVSRYVNTDGDYVSRLHGFSSNPNQLAFHALCSAVLSMFIFRRDNNIFPLIGLCAAGAIGFLATSDAFVIGFAVLLVLTISLGIIFSGSFILGLTILLPAIAGAALIWGKVASQFLRISQEGDQDTTRFTLWINGIEAGLMHPIIGWGPGTWSGPFAPLELEEAHNSAIDYFSSAGLLGLAVLTVGMGYIYTRTFISKNAALFAGVLAISAYAMFHNVLRQPVTWMTLYILTQSAIGLKQSRRRHRKHSSRDIGF